MPAPWPDATVTDRRFRLALPAPTPCDLPFVEHLLAGAAEVDLTPPPGMPKAGHSRNAQDGTGFRTRLKARVIHLRHGHTSLALIACDLLAGSALIHRALARAVDDLDVPVSGLLMTATHTHAGPGQYSGSEFYNRWASNRAGFDPDYAGFLVAQLETAVREAVATRRPAAVAVGSTEVWGLTRNRSLPAHVRNPEVSDKRVEAQRKYAAINPDLVVLRVDDEAGPMAAFTWFSVHGTGISSKDPSYNADVWAYVNGEIRDRVGQVISGAAVATHGDMTPAVRPGVLAFPEAERVGRGIGAAAAEVFAGLTPSSDVSLAASLRDVDLREHPEVDGIVLPEPRIGFPKLGGAEENETFLVARLPVFRPGSTRRRHHPEQAEKQTFDSAAMRAVAGARADTFPQLLPVHLLRIDDTHILGLPFEVTVEAGRRIAAQVTEQAGGRTVVSSLTGDHCDYLTTAEEYAAQHYEGASTLYGPHQQAFVAGLARDLAAGLGEGHSEQVAAREFDFTVHRYLPRPTGVAVTRRLEPPRFVDATPSEDAYWEMVWHDVAPGDLIWHEPLVRVEDESGAVVADDQGWRVGVTLLRSGRGSEPGAMYAARWYAPPLGRPGRHRFVLVANAGQPEVASALFD